LKNISIFFLYLFWYKKLDLLKTKKTKNDAYNPQITPIFETQYSIIFILFYALLNSAQIVLITFVFMYTLLLLKNRFKVSGGKKFGSKWIPGKIYIK
jgi:hypothetical protein